MVFGQWLLLERATWWMGQGSWIRFLKKILLRLKLLRKWKTISLHIITNNIKEIQNKNKRLSIIEYFKNKKKQEWNIIFIRKTFNYQR